MYAWCFPLGLFVSVFLQEAAQVVAQADSELDGLKLMSQTLSSARLTWTSDLPTPTESQLSESSGAVVTVVKSGAELAAALENGSEHIEIQDHLDLTLLGWHKRSEFQAVWEIPEFVRSLRGNCASPFPTSTNLGIQSFQPSEALPEKSEGLVCASTCTEDLLIAEMTHAMETYPILVQNILFHSVNPSTKTALRVQRNAVLTNVSVSGTKGGAKTAVFTGPAGAVHLEDSAIVGFSSQDYVMTHAGVATSYTNVLLDECSVRSAKGAAIYALANFSPVILQDTGLENLSMDNLLMNGMVDCCNPEPQFFSDIKRAVALNFSPPVPIGGIETTTFTAPLEDAPTTQFISLQSDDIIKTIQEIETATRQSPDGTSALDDVAPEPEEVTKSVDTGTPDSSSTATNSPDSDGEEDEDVQVVERSPPGRTNTTLIAGVSACAGVVLLAVAAAIGWRLLAKKRSEDRDDGDIEDARSAHKGSHKPASNTTLSSHAPPKHPVSSQMETASMRSYSNHGHESSVQMAATSGAGWTKSIQSSGSGGGGVVKPYDTLDEHTFTSGISQRPSKGAPARQWQEYLESQLDSLVGKVVLESLTILDGPGSRLHGGQATVQMAEEHSTRDQLALKFFLSERVFQQEKNLYMDPSNPLGKFLPELYVIAEGEKCIKDIEGNPLPQCIVMEKGESLDTWAEASGDRLDIFTGLQVLSHISERLKDLHEAGYAHRDLKPGNVIWLPKKKRWTLIDFGCAAKIGRFAATGFSMFYAAPEAIRAFKSGEEGIVATEGLDAWSLGILAIEMFSGKQPFEVMQDKEETMHMVLGTRYAPWEDPKTASAIKRKLGHLQKPVLSLLDRDPAKRLTVSDFQKACRRVISNTTMGHSGPLY